MGILIFIVKRILIAVPVLIGMSILVFSLIHLVPGDPALPVRVDDETEARLAIVEAIERGRADVRAGRVVPHEDVACEAREIIEAVRIRSL